MGKATPNVSIAQRIAGRWRKKDTPLVIFIPLTALLYTAPVPCSISLSPSIHRSMTFAPSMINSTSFLVTWLMMSAAV